MSLFHPAMLLEGENNVKIVIFLSPNLLLAVLVENAVNIDKNWKHVLSQNFSMNYLFV